MSVSIAISPLSKSLEMYGEPDTSSAYSLSGHVSISLTSQASMFETRRATRLLLQSLTITFEGQSEVVTREIGYAPLRLCSMTRELAPSEPLELSNEGHEHSDKPCTWNVVFNLPVPGWLPTTSTYGDWMQEETGTSYALYATAKFASLDDESDRSWSFSTLCSMFRPKSKVVYAERCPITLSRFISPPSIPASDSLFPMANFAIRRSACLKADIISKVQVLVSVPEHIPADATSMPFTIRLRTSDLSEEDTKRLRLSAFSVDVQQQERYRGMPSRDFLTHYPIPSPSNQPPNRALLAPHRLSTLFETGLLSERRDAYTCVTRSFSLTPDLEPMTYEIAGDGRVFADDFPARAAPTWYTVTSTVPLAARSPSARQRRVSERTPLFGVGHEVRVALVCAYAAPGVPEPLHARLSFAVPVQFANVTPAAARPEDLLDLSPASPASSASSASSRSASPLPPPMAMAMPKSLPYAHSLPAYSQLFDSNGDRKIDYSVLLPLYTPEDQAADAPPQKSP